MQEHPRGACTSVAPPPMSRGARGTPPGARVTRIRAPAARFPVSLALLLCIPRESPSGELIASSLVPTTPLERARAHGPPAKGWRTHGEPNRGSSASSLSTRAFYLFLVGLFPFFFLDLPNSMLDTRRFSCSISFLKKLFCIILAVSI